MPTDPPNTPRQRCGKCPNCLQLEKVKRRVLACVNPPFSRRSATWPHACADDGVIELWNSELARLPCTAEDDDAWLNEPEKWGTDDDGTLIRYDEDQPTSPASLNREGAAVPPEEESKP